MDIEFSGTKERIFDAAVMLIAKDGFENVSMRDIANGAGVNAATIYNHFAGKEEILDTIYLYFSSHRLDNRRSISHIKSIVETGSSLDLVTVLSDSAFEFEEKKAVRLILIPKIILMRIFKDDRANRFFLHEWYGEDVKHLKKWLGYAVEIGRLPKEFDIDNYAMFFWRQMVMMGIWAFADKNYEVRILDEEQHLLDMFSKLLPLGEPLRQGPGADSGGA